MTKIRCGSPICVAARPTPGRRVHGLGHVVDELLDLGRDALDGQRLLAQARVGVVEDGANGHDRFLRSLEEPVSSMNGQLGD